MLWLELWHCWHETLHHTLLQYSSGLGFTRTNYIQKLSPLHINHTNIQVSICSTPLCRTLLSQKLLSSRCACVSYCTLNSQLINFKHDISLLGYDAVSMGKWFLTVRTRWATKPTSHHHTLSSMSMTTSTYSIISIALKQFYVSKWIQVITCNAILLTSHCMRVMKPTWCTIYLHFIQSLYLYMFRAC
jgi:hypothetical protein